ncbi:hypothetical protein [Phaeovulum vinaykumarii]|uniref:N-acetyltransferase domain-containing protein n=1 Tax=Phaeovulum vinaykumarii TaxID=407234 RepID=A0A1N7L942_9RHOB|nr:hypothetical protein [Phaeovulum vinaykumarii]SIS70303.1 hypothetical protein SAMN05421795_102705 [Phaeovulum vinaykumarii]SOB98987.1 hypothetical protein SAMN05878426_10267 [Phaeovulum vinaykumarii]
MESSLPEEERRKVVIHIGQEVADIPQVLPLVQQMHKESLFSDLPFDQPQFERICGFIRDNPGFNGGLYAEYDGAPVAFAYYVFRPFMGSRKSWVTVMHTLYLRADVRATPLGGYIWQRILMAVRAWSAPRGSRGIMFNVTSGIAIEETDTVLRTGGATHLGGNITRL